MEPTGAPPTTTPPVPPAKKNNTLVLILLAIIILLLGFGGGYMFKGQSSSPATSIITATPTQAALTISPSPTSAPPAGKALWKTFTSKKLAENSLPAYMIQYPEDWTLTNNHQEGIDSTQITKDGYTIAIGQGGFDISLCVFDGEAPEGPTEYLKGVEFTEIETASGTLRRYLTNPQPKPTEAIFAFCGSADGKNFYKPTYIGLLNYTVPKNYSEDILKEMDSILKTLQKTQ